MADTDMLVKLYELKDLKPFIDRIEAEGYHVKRAIMPEMETVCAWVQEHFGQGWAAECRGCFTNHPVSLYVAYKENEIAGFGCYDSTYKDFFGPTGVDSQLRGKGLGAALLMSCLHDMKTLGYAYAIIGGAGPVHYYEKVCGATPIEGSWPGIYKDMLRPKKR